MDEIRSVGMDALSVGGNGDILDNYIRNGNLFTLALLVAVAQQSEKGKRYADEHDTPATGRTPWLFIRYKPGGCTYCILEAAPNGLVYAALPLAGFLKTVHKFPKTEEESRALDIVLSKISPVSSVELLEKINRIREDKDSGSQHFSDMVDAILDEIDEYFEPVGGMTYEQARRKYGAVIAS